MNIGIKWSALRDTSWHQYLIRFVLGGAVTAGAGAIATLFGPETGGLFLAFPAIFGASATLIEKHERERKERAGLQGTRRGREAVAVDAASRTRRSHSDLRRDARSTMATLFNCGSLTSRRARARNC
jgi:hypothetical protein